MESGRAPHREWHRANEAGMRLYTMPEVRPRSRTRPAPTSNNRIETATHATNCASKSPHIHRRRATPVMAQPTLRHDLIWVMALAIGLRALAGGGDAPVGAGVAPRGRGVVAGPAVTPDNGWVARA